MDTKSCSVVFEGQLAAGRTRDEVKQNLAQLFKTSAGQVDRLFSAQPVIVKKNLSRETALKYRSAFEKAGAICRIQEAYADGCVAVKSTPDGSGGSAGLKENTMTCPMCSFEQAQAEECVRCGTVVRKYLQKINRAAAVSGTASSPMLIRPSTAGLSRMAWLLPLPVVLLLLIFLFIRTQEIPAPLESEVIIPATPVQSRIGSPRKFSHKGCKITPLAKFEIEARVLSAKRYYFGRQADLSPVDLALGWGPMSDERILEDIEIRQSNRFYFWRVKQFPIPRKEIQQNSANMHMIPADETIEKRLKKIRKGHLIRFSGYLVRVDSRDNWFWKSSLTRKDTGNGACELVWVEELEFS